MKIRQGKGNLTTNTSCLRGTMQAMVTGAIPVNTKLFQLCIHPYDLMVAFDFTYRGRYLHVLCIKCEFRSEKFGLVKDRTTGVTRLILGYLIC